jgi:hypothetical protein
MRQGHFRFTLLAVCLGMLWAGRAAADPVQSCQVAKLNAAGTRAACLAAEQVKELQGKPPQESLQPCPFSPASGS